jgi:hypothetical protein
LRYSLHWPVPYRAARDRKTAKYFSREAGARRGWALVSATLRPLYAVWFVAKILSNE